MSIARAYEWRTAGCNERCWPRQHDPDAHELHGYLLALVRPPRTVVRSGPLTVDLLSPCTVTVNGAAVHLTPTEWRIVETLARQQGRLVPHAAMVEAVFGVPADAATLNALRAHMGRLRAALGEGGQQIVTRRRIGFRLEAV